MNKITDKEKQVASDSRKMKRQTRHDPHLNERKNSVNMSKKKGKRDSATTTQSPIPKELDTELSQAQAKAAEYLDGWQRAQAELDNYRKEVAKNSVAIREQVTGDVFLSLFTLVDNFYAMTKQVPPEIRDHSWTVGVLHVARQLDQILQSFGITEIDSLNTTFDPLLHEAVHVVNGQNSSANTVVAVVRPGYILGERVLRPTQVTVTKSSK